MTCTVKDPETRRSELIDAAEVFIGTESGYQAALDAINKGAKVEQIEICTRTMREARHRCPLLLYGGNPGHRHDGGGQAHL